MGMSSAIITSTTQGNRSAQNFQSENKKFSFVPVRKDKGSHNNASIQLQNTSGLIGSVKGTPSSSQNFQGIQSKVMTQSDKVRRTGSARPLTQKKDDDNKSQSVKHSTGMKKVNPDQFINKPVNAKQGISQVAKTGDTFQRY